MTSSSWHAIVASHKAGMLLYKHLHFLLMAVSAYVGDSVRNIFLNIQL